MGGSLTSLNCKYLRLRVSGLMESIGTIPNLPRRRAIYWIKIHSGMCVAALIVFICQVAADASDGDMVEEQNMLQLEGQGIFAHVEFKAKTCCLQFSCD